MNTRKSHYFFAMLILVILLCPIRPASAIKLSKEEQAYLHEKNTIVFISQTRYPPFEFVDKNGEHTGMCIELARWMATELGFTARFVDSSFQEAQKAILSGKADVLTSLFYSEKRDELFAFTQVMFEVPASIFVVAERTDIKDLSDLNGKLIAMQSGDYAKEYLESKKISFDVVYTKDFADATDLVIAGKADAVIGDEQIVLYHVFKNGLTKEIKKVGDPLYIGQNCMATKEPNQVLADILEKGISQARKSGILEKINRKWIGTRFALRESLLFKYFPHILLSIGAAFMLLLLVWFWNIKLRHVVSKRTEELEKSEEKFSTLFQASPVYIAFTALDDGCFLEVNDAFTEITGYQRKEVVGRTPVEIGLWPNPEERTRFINLAQQDGGFNEQEVKFLRKNGEPLFGLWSAEKIVLGGETCLISVLVDVTERRRTEQALRESEEKFSKLFFSNPSWMAVTTLEEGRYLDVNDAFEEITGFDREEVVGRTSTEIGIWQDPGERKRFVKLAKEEGGFREEEVALLNKKGDPIFGLWSADMIKLGGEACLISTVMDISELRRAEEEKEQLQDKLHRARKMEAMGLMAGGIAHDLNNILSGIVSYPELLLMDLPEDSPMRKPIETMQESGMRAADVVEDLLTIARGVATGIEALNLNTIVTEYLESAEYEKLEKAHSFVSLKTELDPDLLNISGSPTHIRKTLMNLIMNASEAIEGGGTVNISTTSRYLDEPLKLKGYEDVRTGEYAVLSVSDDGSGITHRDLEKIFEPFYTKKVMGRSGTGLGLAVVWNTVRDHKGYINVKTSEKGTVFELYFPVTREEVAAEGEEVPVEDYLGHGEKILVVDDEERQREIACGMLTKLGYTAEAVSSGEEAIEYMKENTVDLIVLDMVMPKGINGRETYEQIIKIRPEQKAVIASGYAKTKEVDSAQELGAGKYIKKPYTLEKIGVAVKEELEK